MKSLKNRPILLGTLILTFSGFLTRGIGFFFRILSSRILGAEKMGLYQLSAPVLALSYSLCAGSFHTAVSKTVAEKTAKEDGHPIYVLLAGILFALPLSLLVSTGIFLSASFLATQVLLEPALGSYLRILAWSIPLSSLHACTNGYFYGIKKSQIPAISQIVEQTGRIGFICIGYFLFQKDFLNLMFFGIIFGEGFALLFNLFFINTQMFAPAVLYHGKEHFKSVLKIAIPTGANRLSLNLMQSFEAIVLPNSLRLFGYSRATALSIYGTLTGMALPFLLFPNALTMSLSTILLPEISTKQASNETTYLKQTIRKAILFSLFLGMTFSFLFLIGGQTIGEVSFHNPLAGKCIVILALSCPFLYVNTTMAGILQGMGKIVSMYLVNLVSLGSRLAFVLFLVPRFGMPAYFVGLYLSQVLQNLLYLRLLYLPVH